MEASLCIANCFWGAAYAKSYKSINYKARQIRTWAFEFYNFYIITPSLKGEHAKSMSCFAHEDIKAKLLAPTMLSMHLMLWTVNV